MPRLSCLPAMFRAVVLVFVAALAPTVNAQALLGQTLQIGGQAFEVIGVLNPKGAAMSWMNPDEQILIPLGTARYRLMGTDRVRQIGLQVKDGVPLEQGMVDIERILRREHKIRPGADNDFQIRNQQEILATQHFLSARKEAECGIGVADIIKIRVAEPK